MIAFIHSTLWTRTTRASKHACCEYPTSTFPTMCADHLIRHSSIHVLDQSLSIVWLYLCELAESRPADLSGATTTDTDAAASIHLLFWTHTAPFSCHARSLRSIDRRGAHAEEQAEQSHSWPSLRHIHSTEYMPSCSLTTQHVAPSTWRAMSVPTAVSTVQARIIQGHGRQLSQIARWANRAVLGLDSFEFVGYVRVARGVAEASRQFRSSDASCFATAGRALVAIDWTEYPSAAGRQP